MIPRARVLFSLMMLLLFPGSIAAAPGATNLAEHFISNFNAGNTAALEKACAPAFWEGKHDSPQKLIRQGYGKKRQFNLALAAITSGTDRAVFDVGVVNAATGKPADLIYLYAEPVKGTWLLTGLNEEKAFRAAFLAGKINGGFHPMDLPPSPALDQLAAKVLALLPGMAAPAGVDPLEKAFGGLFTVATSRRTSLYPTQLAMFASLKDPGAFEAHWSADLGRGVVIWSDRKTESNAWPEKFCGVFRSGPSGWELLDVTSFPSMSSFLKE